MLTFGAKADDSDDARQIIGNCAIYDFSFSTFQLVYASPDTSCVFIFSFDRREGKPCSIFVQVYNLQERALLSCLINKNESFSLCN